VHPRLRQKLLAEWRGLPETPLPSHNVQPVGPAVDRLLERLGLSERIDEQEILACWKGVVGDFLAEHSCPTGLHEGCLTVRVSQPTVRYELDRVWKTRILQALQKQFGKNKVRSLRFQL
jgi:predicted nucleic acid-binding Zn ribbon protein